MTDIRSDVVEGIRQSINQTFGFANFALSKAILTFDFVLVFPFFQSFAIESFWCTLPAGRLTFSTGTFTGFPPPRYGAPKKEVEAELQCPAEPQCPAILLIRDRSYV